MNTEQNKEQAFEIVAKIIHDRGVELIIGGNPAFETEFVLFYIESTMIQWGFKNPKVAAYCDAIKAENDNFRAMGIC
jgi:hypothetical protein